MMDIEHPSLVRKWSPNFSSHQAFFEKLSNSAASWLAAMKSLVLADVDYACLGNLPAAPSLWDQLMVSSAQASHLIATGIAKEQLQQERTLMSSLLEFVPRFDKYYPAKRNKLIGVYGPHTQVFVGLANKKSLCFLSNVEATSSTFRYPPVVTTLPSLSTLPPGIPTIIVTDADGPMSRGADNCYSDEMYRAMTSGKGLLWSRWSGKFSPSQCGSEIECGDEMYFEGREDEEGEAQLSIEVCFEVQEAMNLDTRKETNVSNFIPVEPTIRNSNELEWWEIEESDDEAREADEDSDSDSDDGDGNDDDDDDDDDDGDDNDSGSDGNENLHFSDSEDGDDEHEHEYDSEDDDSGEDSDFGEESKDKEVPFAVNNHLLDNETSVPPLSRPKLNSVTIIPAYTKSFESHGQSAEKGSDAELSPSSCLSLMDSDFESCKSGTTISSLSTTPITPSSPCVLPVDGFSSIRGKAAFSETDYIIGLRQLLGNPPRSVLHLDLEIGAFKNTEWYLEPNGRLEQKELSLEGALNIEALDLAR